MYSLNEDHFKHYFSKITNESEQYLNLPTEISFNTLINESINYCRKRKEINRVRDSSIFLEFCEYLKTDRIFKKLDESEYYNLLDKLSQGNSNSIKIEELENYLKKIRHLFSKKYFNKVVEELKIELKNKNCDFTWFENLILIFVNELLVERVSFPFLNRLFHEDFIKKGLFRSLKMFLDYVSFDETENVEMLLPIINYTDRDLLFLQSQDQKIEVITKGTQEKVYCKVFATNIDYFNVCHENMVRIESYFNFFKFYRESKISFNFNDKVLIKRTKIISDSFDIIFSSLVSYTYFVGKQGIIDNTISNVSKLKDCDNPLFYSINNILSYAEKDNDILSVSSFVDNWIALENIIKLSHFKIGFDGVIDYVPKVLDVQYYRKVLNETLKKNKPSTETITIDRFIDKIFSRDLSFLNDYKFSDCLFMEREVEIALSFNKLRAKLDNIRSYLLRDLRRIYDLRNEYVHSSNIKAHRGVLPFKLKRILADFFDIFMKTLNSHLKTGHFKVDGRDVISDIIKKHDNRTLLLKICSIGYSINGVKITRNLIESDINLKEMYRNIVFDRIRLLNSKRFEDEN